LILLGSTGSIGVNVLNIAREFDLEVETLVAGNSIELLNKQIKEFHPDFVVVAKKELIPLVKHNKVFYGEEGILEVINLSKSKLVVNALVGFLGLKPTLEALRLDKKLALANKESLVVAGAFVDNSKIIPIDSEHFAVWYLLNGRDIDKIILTASGGPFRDMDIAKIKNQKAGDALNHPNWKMGKKISIDSATMTNKLFELLEAKWLFGIDKVDALIEKNSVIHALLEFKDGSTTAHFAGADMRLPISYAVLGDEPSHKIIQNVNLLEMKEVNFKKIESKRYPIWQIKDDILKHPKMGVVVNAANEIAVEAFLKEEIPFFDISKITLSSYEKFQDIKLQNFDDIFEVDKEVRLFAKEMI
jgi:1-deoxy-D-xylulose-5-phosphate reductoisomerase